MRPLRFLLSLATCILAFFFLLFIGPWRASTQDSLEHRSPIRSYLHWRTPSSLFPPSALITLTDDNSTFFFARPAAFGPLLPAKSLTGQLWIGSGFGEDRLGRSGAAEGELGCSDVPGWGAAGYISGGKSLSDAKGSWASSQSGISHNKKRSDGNTDDGTDDYLHHPLPASDGMKSSSTSRKSTHADIQSLQESAEIAGKIVLLSRGGCGFLEKVKWVQRRSGKALMVGDDIRGEPLVTMYARGDTSNVTIPSLFVSYTTAHLLSGLIPSGSLVSGLSPEEGARLGLAPGSKTDMGKLSEEKDVAADDKPTFTTSTAPSKPSPISNKDAPIQGSRNAVSSEDNADTAKVGWLGSIFGKKADERKLADNRRPPTSGDMGWILQEEFDDDLPGLDIYGKHSTTSTTSSSAPTKTPEADADEFVIGVQDWRDPDLVAYRKERLMPSTSTSTESAKAVVATAVLRGGSITPGSGEYAKAVHEAVDVSDAASYGQQSGSTSEGDEPKAGWFGRLFGSSDNQPASDAAPDERYGRTSTSSSQPGRHGAHSPDSLEVHEGLWVTLTPTSMSSSPFFDTLLVLVVSPLVTLTIVYALLLLRSRIRRRRWRAPKSVVERLPVRTYQTMSSAGTISSTTSSISTPITATTPLLPSNARPITARPRPRSRTTSEVPDQQSTSLRSDSSASTPSLDQIEEKRAAGLAEWRRRYGGKQRECVVCLEEYVDGVSRVMSLPCGHEFHAECMYVCILTPYLSTNDVETDGVCCSTPWLTTRRRTCPICKGDVVRSLAQTATNNSPSSNNHTVHSSSSSPPAAAAAAEVLASVEEDVDEAALQRDEDPVSASASPLLSAQERERGREQGFEEDLERGIERDGRR